MQNFSLAIIIPNYNKEKYITTCINSILEQTYLPNEIVIVDDCSTDGSQRIISEFEEKTKGLVKGIFLKENGGVSNARNIGLANVQSDYVSFTDADDFYFSTNKLKNEMELIKAYAEKGIEVVAYSAIVRVSKNGSVNMYPNLMKPNFMKGKILLDLLAYVNLENIPRDYCIKKETILKVGAYSYPRNLYEDLELLLRLSKVVQFYPTYQYGIAYRMTDNGLSKRPKEEHVRELETIMKIHSDNLKKSHHLLVFLKKKLFILWKLFRKVIRILMR